MPRSYHILMVTSSGGVFLDLLALEPWWKLHRVSWAAVRAPDTESILAAKSVLWMPERRVARPFGALLGALSAFRVLRSLRPDVVVSAGSGVAIGFFLAARLLRIPSFWLETLNFIDRPALSGRICSHLASEILVQRESMLRAHPRAILLGELY